MPQMKVGKSLFLLVVTLSAPPQTFAFGVVRRRNLAIVSEGKSNRLQMTTSGGSADTSLDSPTQEVRVLDYNIVVSKECF
jgi:hypothetical protein